MDCYTKMNTSLEDILHNTHDEPFIFGMQDKQHEFSVELSTILECVLAAEKEGYLPKISKDWWSQVAEEYKKMQQ